jgi:TatA/E family protein of Tat protein translocase
MNVLGMGPMEIVLIVVLALIVFGPAKLPQIMGQVGKAIADFRRATSELSDEFNRTIQAELQETKAVVDETKSAVTGVHTSINAALTGTPAPALTTAPAPAAANGVNGANGTNGTAVADAPPLADTAKWSWETAAPAPEVPAAETTTAVATAVTEPEPSPAAEPSTAVETPSEKPVESPAQRPTRSRKATGRDEILPPY